MVLSFFGGGADAASLIAQKKYGKAIEILREQLQRGAGAVRVRQQLADTLLLAGRGREAVPHLLDLADEYAATGQAAKAIALLKKVQRVDPGSAEAEGKLASLIKDKTRPKGWNPVGAAARGYEPVSWGQAYSAASFGDSEQPVYDEKAQQARMAALRQQTWVPSTTREDPSGSGAMPAVPPPSGEAAPLPPVPPPSAAAPQETPAEEEAPIEVVPEIILDVIQEALHAPQASAPPSEVAEVKDSPLFSGFSEEELVAVIRGLRLLSYQPGDIILTEGDAGDSLFVLTTGTVKAFVRRPEGGQAMVRTLGEGEFFGEISILSGKPRTATVTAATPCELLELDRPTLDGISATHPRVLSVLEDFYIQRASTQDEAVRRATQGGGEGA